MPVTVHPAPANGTGGADLRLPARAGKYFTWQQTNSAPLAAAREWAVLLPTPTIPLTGLWFRVTTAGTAGAVARLALRAVAASGLPGAVIAGTEGTVSTTSTGSKALTFGSPAAGLPSVVFAVIVAQVADCTIDFGSVNAWSYRQGLGVSSLPSVMNANGITAGIYQDGVTGALGGAWASATDNANLAPTIGFIT